MKKKRFLHMTQSMALVLVSTLMCTAVAGAKASPAPGNAPTLAKQVQTASTDPLDFQKLQQIYAYQELIYRFYDAFARGDAEAMVSCYHPEVQFEDAAFGRLQGEDAKDMWRMLVTQGGSNLRVKYKNVHVAYVAKHPEHLRYVGQAHWDADYTFSLTGNPVHNSIDATFGFKDGLIYTHRDRFDFQVWSSQALGLPGIFLGGHPFFQERFQAIARQRLQAFQREQGKSDQTL